MRGCAWQSKTRGGWNTLPFDYTFLGDYAREKDEDRKNGTAMGGGHPDKRDGCVHERYSAAGRAIKNESGYRTARSKEEECRVEEGHREIWGARGCSTRPGAGEQRRVGVVDRGCGERGDTVRTECGQIFCAGVEHEALQHGAGAGETRAGFPVSYDAGNTGSDFERRSTERRCCAGGPGRHESFEPKISLSVEGRVRWAAGKGARGAGRRAGGEGREGNLRRCNRGRQLFPARPLSERLGNR